MPQCGPGGARPGSTSQYDWFPGRTHGECMTDDEDFDPDDIAYVGDEDDVRGPGCLAGISLICGGFGVIGFLSSLAWLISIGAFDAPGNQAPGNPLYLMLVPIVMVLSVLAGGFGMGLGLFTETKARLAANPDQLRLLARIAAILGGVAVIGVVGQVLLVLVRNPWR